MKFALQPTSLIDYPGKLSCVVFVPGCDLRCPFCHNPGLVECGSEDQPSLIGEEDLEYFLQKRRKVLEAVVISGGEASLWKGLKSFIDGLKASGYMVKLDSNGMNPQALEPLDPDFVAIDLKTAPGAYALRIPQAPKDAADRLASSLEWARSRPGMEVRTTLAPGIVGMDDLPLMANLLKSGDDWILQRFRPGHTLDPSWSQMLPYTEADHEALLERARSSVPGARLR